MIKRILRHIRPSPKAPTPSPMLALLKKADHFASQGNVAALEDMQRLVMRPIQSRHMVDAYLKSSHEAIESLQEWRDIGLSYLPDMDQSLFDLIQNKTLDDQDLPVARLGRDIVLPTCWHPSSIENMTGKLGNDRGNPWTQDSNHKLSWWYPLNIFWVNGGNHSITQGIILAEGEIKANQGYDLSALYEYVAFDGQFWLSKQSGKRIGRPRYAEIGYIYEIGRRIISSRF